MQGMSKGNGRVTAASPPLMCLAVAGPARARFAILASLRRVSLLQADRPQRVLKPAGLGILNQRKPGCLAAFCTGKFLGRYGGAIDGPAEPADDDQDIAHNNLHGHAARRVGRDRRPIWKERGQGAPMSMIGLVSDVADQRGLAEA